MSAAPPPPASSPPPWLGPLLAWLLPTLVVAALFWPLPLGLGSELPVTGFTGPQVWQLDRIGAQLLGARSWGVHAPEIGHPDGALLHLVGWVPILLAAPFYAVFGPVTAFNLAWLLTPGLSGLATRALLRRLSGVGDAVALPAAVLYALCPYQLGALASGALEKTQLWMFPLVGLSVLLAADAFAPGRPRRARLGLAAPALAVAAAGFTDPSLAIWALAAGPAFGLVALWRAGWAEGGVGPPQAPAADPAAPDPAALGPAAPVPAAPVPAALGRTPPPPGRRPVATAALLRTLAGLGLALLLALPALGALRAYYATVHNSASAVPEAFVPLSPVASEGDAAGPLVSVAEPVRVLRGPEQRALEPHLHYVTYVGLPALLLALLAWERRGRGRWLGAALFAVGLALAAGPQLVVGDSYVRVDGERVSLPAAWLEVLGSPTAKSGSYYRVMPVAWLGLVLLFAGAAGELRGRLGRVLPGLAALLLVADFLRVTSFLWPAALAPVDGRATLEAWRADPTPGAVLDLPLAESLLPEGGVSTNHAVLAAVFHGRATSALPRSDMSKLLSTRKNLELLQTALGPGPAGGPAALRRGGFRYVAWYSDAPGEGWALEGLERLLGPARQDGKLRYWVVE